MLLYRNKRLNAAYYFLKNQDGRSEKERREREKNE